MRRKELGVIDGVARHLLICPLPNSHLGASVFDTLQAPRPTALRLSGWNIITATNLDELQDLLEALEDVGFERQVFILNSRRFAVAWR
jgi:hypothetical protein